MKPSTSRPRGFVSSACATANSLGARQPYRLSEWLSKGRPEAQIAEVNFPPKVTSTLASSSRPRRGLRPSLPSQRALEKLLARERKCLELMVNGGKAAQQEAQASKSGGGGGDVSVTSTISDLNASGTAYYMQSDGLGPYDNGQAGVQSILQATANYDWELSTYNSSWSGSSGRNALITLGPANQQSASATLPSIWTSWGMHMEPVRFIDKCSYINVDMLTIKPGSPQACPILIRFGPDLSSGRTTTYYRLDMAPNLCKSCIAEPETQDAQISCNIQDASGNCNDWSIDSIPPTSQSGGISANQMIARLILVNSGGGLIANDGDFYLTFHIHVTNP